MNKELIPWSDIFSIDKKIIDSQHKILIKLINELYAAFLDGKANDHISNILDELTKYTVSHFKTEEVFFEEVNYDDADNHKKEHQDFVYKVVDFKTKFKEGDVSLSYDIMNFLRDWLQNHILVSDRKYISYLK